MLHPIYTTSFEDMEMFAHNVRVAEKKAKMEKHLADPYNRIKYAYYFMGTDAEMDAKCMSKIYKYLSTDIDCECHY